MAVKNKTTKFISFSGPSCSGKTTLVSAIDWSNYFKKFYLVESHTRALKAKGMKINDKGSDETQIKIMDIHHINYEKYNIKSNGKKFITDRCVLDGIVYSEWLANTGRIHKNVYEYAVKIFMDIKDKIDILFYCEPVEYVDDADRKLSKKDHNMICGLFESYLGIFDLNQVVRLKGSVEERLKIVDNKLKFDKVNLTEKDILLWNN
jgi:nicotinamide riboside kinase